MRSKVQRVLDARHADIFVRDVLHQAAVARFALHPDPVVVRGQLTEAVVTVKSNVTDKDVGHATASWAPDGNTVGPVAVDVFHRSVLGWSARVGSERDAVVTVLHHVVRYDNVELVFRVYPVCVARANCRRVDLDPPHCEPTAILD